MRIPKHIGVIPDGNRRWAVRQGKEKGEGYDSGLDPGLELFKLCQKVGVNEITYYGFTTDNTKRPREQRLAFTEACVNAVKLLAKEDAALLVIGNTESAMFPKDLLPYTTRQIFGKGTTKVNFLVNYGWEWDLNSLHGANEEKVKVSNVIKSSDISRVDLIIRWGGRRRLSGFLPVQSIYADFYVVDDYWPDFKKEHFYEAVNWYDKQDITLGG
ncbi:undecaprenyl diphosphate synthase [Clostridium cavendishii DSM 21758]|uniref:Undecaprenyl diphosphate synthase n=1 Tax=Clostridium cavendishii DSM 21758 TaxID=1121302 RepID=A0A1M6SMC1_9CLOT|nr:undecaprenyl diphosphate synthase family protein [Clostridium cavendishii]SHK45790.1 undecaprenyl diphosphate synthase [Clostridium cavendishii DSM 21758]